MTPRGVRIVSGLALGLVLLGIAWLCSGCAVHRYPSAETCHHGEHVWDHETECSAVTDAHLVCPVLNCLADAALSQAQDRARVLAALQHTTVDLYGVPVQCGGYAAHGCQDGDNLLLETPSAAADEQGHRLWPLLTDGPGDAGPGSGEWRCATPDGGGDRTCYLQSFEDFVGPCRGAHYP